MNFRSISFTALLITLFISNLCIGQNAIDLSDKGIPVTIMVPDGAIIEEGIGNGLELAGSLYHAWEINKGDFSIEVSMVNDEMWQEPIDYLYYEKSFCEVDNRFVEFVLLEPQGFIVHYRNSETGKDSYDFYYLFVKNNHAIEFSIGLSTNDYSLENIQVLYAAAKTAK